MRIRHLIVFLLAIGLCATGAMADTYTAYPSGVDPTGTTTYGSKTGGEALVYGGESSGTGRMESGYFKFDTTAIPGGTVVNVVNFHFYVNNTYFPYWSTTPLTGDPSTTDAATLWEDIQAEKSAGYYNYQSESSTYAPGWKVLMLEGTAVDDFNAGYADGYFALGAASRDDGFPDYYLEIDGSTDPFVPYLVVTDDPEPTCEDVMMDLGDVGCPGTLMYSGDTSGAWDFCGNASGDNHFSFTVTDPGNFTLTLCGPGTTYDTYIRLYDDTCCGNQIAYDDDDPTCAYGTLQSRIDEIELMPGTYYVHVEGYSSGEGAYDLTIDCLNSLIFPPSDMACEIVGDDIALTWVNNDTYDGIEVYEDAMLIATIGATETSYTVMGVTPGYHCYYVCGQYGTELFCSGECCELVGFSNVDLIWDFEDDDGGFITDGTHGWQWGVPTYGPCAGDADGNVWATRLDSDYINNACYVLDTPVVEMGVDGGYIAIDHCINSEFSWDGGCVWFGTDGVTYTNLQPLDGYDDDSMVASGCSWTAGEPGFTGESGGWVTDLWELLDEKYIEYGAVMKIAFGSDSSVAAGYSGWMIDNVTVYRNLDVNPIGCDYTITPLEGVGAFWTHWQITLSNLLEGDANYRRVQGTISVTIGNGTFYDRFRSGWRNIPPSTAYQLQYNQHMPGWPSMYGDNTFVLTATDVTPAPYNQPPYPASGSTCTSTQVVTAAAP